MPSRQTSRRHYKRQQKQREEEEGKKEEQQEKKQQKSTTANEHPSKEKENEKEDANKKNNSGREFQVRYQGGALQFFDSFVQAYVYAIQCDERFDTLSFRHPLSLERIRIQLKRNLPTEGWNWSPESERKISHLAPTYSAALGTETNFWVHQNVLARDELLGFRSNDFSVQVIRDVLTENGAFLDAAIKKEIETALSKEIATENRITLREEIVESLQRLDAIKHVWTDSELLAAFGHL